MKALSLCSEGFSLSCFLVAFLVEYIAEECGLLLSLDFCDCRSLNCLTISGMDKSGILLKEKTKQQWLLFNCIISFKTIIFIIQQ